MIIPAALPDKLAYHSLILAVCLFLALAFSFIDLIDAIRTAQQVGEKVRSHKIRKTFGKTFYYWAFIACGALIDLLFDLNDFWQLPYITIAITIFVGFIEMHSLMEHARKRKDNSAKIEKVLEKIVEVSSKKEAQDLLPKITDVINALNDK